MLARGVPSGINPKIVALLMLVVWVRAKSSAVSVSSVPAPAGWDSAPRRPSGSPVLKKKGSAQAGVASPTVAAMRLTRRGAASARAHVFQLTVVLDRFIRVSSWVRGCGKLARAARLTELRGIRPRNSRGGAAPPRRLRAWGAWGARRGPPCWLVVVIRVVAGDVRVEDVVGRVGHERLGA